MAKQRPGENRPPYGHADKTRPQGEVSVGQPKPIAPEQREGSDDQKQSAAKISQRITACRNAIDIVRTRDVRQQCFVKYVACGKTKVAHREKQRTEQESIRAEKRQASGT
jgi:hypothetical protein